MTDERRPPLPHSSVERHREVAHSDEVRGRGVDPRRVTASQDENAPVTRRELEAFEKRVLDQVDKRLLDYSGGIEAHVRTAVDAAVAPYKAGLEKLPKIAEDAEALRIAAEETRAYRVERDVRERIEKEAKARAEREKVEADVQFVVAQTKNIPVEATTKYRTALFTVVVAAIGLVAALGGAAIHSLAGH